MIILYKKTTKYNWVFLKWLFIIEMNINKQKYIYIF
jgi:hypothetical protein